MNNSSIRRILQISYDMSLGGAETLIMNIYRNIDRTKLQFDFLLHSDTESAYEKEIRNLGGRIYRIPRFLGYNKFSYDRNLTRFLLEHPEYEIIHDHLMDSATETFRIAKKLGRKTIAHSHIVQNTRTFSDLIRFMFRRNLFRYSDYRFACSKAAGEWLYRGKADFQILKNGIEPSKFIFSEKARKQIRGNLKLNDSDFVIGTVGRCVEQKNQRRAIEILKEIHANNERAKLVIIGDGPLKENLKKQAESLGIKESVIFTGAVANVNEYYSSFDVFLFPSLYEGLGIVLVEAQANGLPCVMSSTTPLDVDLIPQIIHRVSLNENDSKWSSTILESKPLENRSLAQTIIRNAGYDIHEIAKDLERFYLGI